jgi:hypothetical protein
MIWGAAYACIEGGVTMRSRGWLVMMAIAGAACSGSMHEGSAAQPAQAAITHVEKTGAFDACTFLGRDEIIAALGSQDFGSGEQRDGGTECRYISSHLSLTVWTNGSLPPESFQEFRDVLKEQHQRIEVAPGIGDDAYFWEDRRDDRIYVRVGGRGFTLEIHHQSSREPRTPTRPALLTLARSGAAKLR